MEPRHSMWTGIGVGLLGVGILGLIALVVWAAQTQTQNLWLDHRFQLAAAILTLIVCAGGYSLIAPFVGLPLPPTRSEPFWHGWSMHLQWPVAFGPAPIRKPLAPSPDQLAEQVKERRAAELHKEVTERFADLPLRRDEVDGLKRVVDWAVQEPLGAVLRGNAASDVEALLDRRANNQLFHMPLMVRKDPSSTSANFMGEVKSDQSLETLNECHRRLMRLVGEVRNDKDYWLGRSDSRQYLPPAESPPPVVLALAPRPVPATKPTPPIPDQPRPALRFDELLTAVRRRQDRVEKRERLRPPFTKALFAMGALTEAIDTMFVGRKFDDAEKKFGAAIAAFRQVRDSLSTEPEGEAIVKIFDRGVTEYRVLETMIHNQEQLLASHSSSAVDYADRVDKQWKLTRAIEAEMKKAVQETLTALGQ